MISPLFGNDTRHSTVWQWVQCTNCESNLWIRVTSLYPSTGRVIWDTFTFPLELRSSPPARSTGAPRLVWHLSFFKSDDRTGQDRTGCVTSWSFWPAGSYMYSYITRARPLVRRVYRFRFCVAYLLPVVPILPTRLYSVLHCTRQYSALYSIRIYVSICILYSLVGTPCTVWLHRSIRFGFGVELESAVRCLWRTRCTTPFPNPVCSPGLGGRKPLAEAYKGSAPWFGDLADSRISVTCNLFTRVFHCASFLCHHDMRSKSDDVLLVNRFRGRITFWKNSLSATCNQCSCSSQIAPFEWVNCQKFRFFRLKSKLRISSRCRVS